eukprot:351929-Chlamydomonas_euryale.AAC.7
MSAEAYGFLVPIFGREMVDEGRSGGVEAIVRDGGGNHAAMWTRSCGSVGAIMHERRQSCGGVGTIMWDNGRNHAGV